MDYIFDNFYHNPDVDLERDFKTLLSFFLFWATLHIFLQKFLFKDLARKYAVLPKHGEGETNEDTAEVVRNDNKQSTAVQRRTTKETSAKPSPTEVDKDYEEKIAFHRRKWQTSAWKFVNYSIQWSFGVYVLMHEAWFPDATQYWGDWPLPLPLLVRYYYFMALGHYLHAMVTIFFEPKQSDLMLMITHHVVTILLIVTSYFSSYHRVGCVIILITDTADPIMEFSKTFLYSGYNKVADVGFVVFSIVFIISRDIIYLYHVFYHSVVYGYLTDGKKIPNYYFFFTTLGILQVFFFFWTYLILKMAYRLIVDKKVKDDVRDE